MSKNIVFSKNAGMKSQIFFQRGVKFPKSSPIYLSSKANKTFAYLTILLNLRFRTPEKRKTMAMKVTGCANLELTLPKQITERREALVNSRRNILW
ncbi:MAG TPA: hypothetical protein DGE56_01965 [Lachnospiraceae bacterium]|nr:hypothetical protein [Lachnospiraceae bacterium]